MRSYRPEELFDADGALRPDLAALAPQGERRMSANPHANGGLLLRDLDLPDFRDYAVDVAEPGAGDERGDAGARRVPARRDRRATPTGSGSWARTRRPRTGSAAVFERTDRAWDAETVPGDDHLAPDGRVMEVLSEHLCQGWLEGYLLTGRHGLFTCYEAFIHIVDSMFNQHAKWLKVTRDIPWRRPIASLNYLLSSHVWRQDHNGFCHQDPGFIDHVVNKKAEVVRVYLPPDANTLLSVADHCLRSRHYVNVIVAGKQPALTYLTMDEAIAHCTRGLGIWEWAGTTDGEPGRRAGLRGRRADAGDARRGRRCCASTSRSSKVRVVNVVDLMRLQPETEHPHGLSDREFDALFTTDKPVIFAYHGYPWLIHRLTYRRTNHHNIHVRGYKEEGTTTTPFDMVMLNDLDRFHLVMDVIDRVPAPRQHAARRCDSAMVDARLAARRLHPRARRGRPGDRRLALVAAAPTPARASVMHRPRRQRRVVQPQARAARRRRRVLAAHRAARRRVGLRPPRACRRSFGCWPDARRGRAPRRARRNATSGRRARRRRRRARLRDAHRPRAAAPAEVARRARRGQRACFPASPAVACFDTAFHATHPGQPRRPTRVPQEWRERWAIRRYGFHGLSHAYCARARRAARGDGPSGLRIVTCHLGAGASLAAVVDGRSVDTTMGFTPLEGLVMATRSGRSIPASCCGSRSTSTSRRATWRPRWSSAPGCSAWPAPATCARSWRAPHAGDADARARARRLRAPPGRGIGADGRRARRPRRARVHRRRRRALAAGARRAAARLGFLGVDIDRSATTPPTATPTSPRRAPVPPSWSPPARTWRSTPRCAGCSASADLSAAATSSIRP